MKRIALYFLISILVVLSACSDDNDTSTTTENGDAKKDELILSIGGEVDDGFDPTTGWGLYGSPLFQSTLLTYDQDFNVQHDLATNYEVSEDGLTYTFELRDDVLFSDGEKLTAEDVVFTYATAQESGSVLDLSNLKQVEAMEAFQVEFTLEHPDSTFITLLATTGIVPKHAYDETYNENPIGSGPYQLVQWDKGEQLIVEANPNYYGNISQFKKLTFLFYEEDAAFAAAKAGKVDVVAITPGFATQEVGGMDLVELDTIDNRGIVFPFVEEGEETEDGVPIGNDVTSDKAIRKAIDVGIDREALVEGVLNGFGTKAFSVADHLPWWNAETEIKDADIKKAKQILDDAGWEQNEEGIRVKGNLEASFDLLYPSGDDIRQSLSLAVADQLKELGIEVRTKDQNWANLENTMYSNPVMMGWGSHDPIEMYNIYSSKTRGKGFYNINYYSNPVVDKHMEEAMRSTTQEEANGHWKKAQWDGETGFSAKGDAPWVWLVNVNHIYLVNENLDIGEQRVQPHGHGWPITDFINDWKWKE
ncbi:ABC transporter substrate-binding protein [Virgibacillus sp. W0181]|uniref:ABC transporter substrate-binding protein n=1 Tax=Virgibacillus sp. W0181 TaxID=3391581 RepID=UPI003F478899